jgi:hypothetical protein
MAGDGFFDLKARVGVPAGTDRSIEHIAGVDDATI